MAACPNRPGLHPETGTYPGRFGRSRAQDGIVSRAQLLSAGVRPTAIHRAVGSGRLHRVHRGVYSTLAPELITEDGVLIAALLAAAMGRSSATAPPHGLGASFPRRR